MFNNYEIKTLENEEVLYLYIDLRTEFGSLAKKKKTTINKEVKKYIKDNKIKFNGKKIVLVASGLILGTMIFTSPLLDNKDYIDYNYTTNTVTFNESIPTSTFTENTTIENITTTETKETTQQETETKKETAKSEVKEESSSNKTNSNNKVNTSNKPTAVKPNTNTNNTSKDPTSTKDTSTKTENKETSITVTIKRSNGTILALELEEYLIGVVGAEMPASFNIEALKAQAVAARTYALKSIQDGVILTDTVKTQAYKDNTELKAMWGSNYTTYYNKIKQAVSDTKGLAIYYNNSLINAFYHSTSNGYTEDASYVFGSYPYLKSVESSVDKTVSSYLRTITLSYEEISNKLDIPVTNTSTINTEKNTSNRISKIIIDNNIYDGVKFRTILNLRSTDFDITLNKDNITITTRGYGHGVGMSQYGANEYAKKGYSYKQILNHYYTNITIKSF